MPSHRLISCFVALSLLALYAESAAAQWENRYAKLSDFGHHVYLEQHELPILASGPTYPAPAPDGERLAFAAQGWIWLLDLESGIATRITDSKEVDSRPRWSADGKRLAFVRDTGSDTSIVIRDMESGDETIINTPTIELDPEFSADGKYLFYTSGRGGVLSLWRRHLQAGTDEQLTDLRQVERNVRRLADGSGIVYLHADGARRTLRVRDFVRGEDTPVREGGLDYRMVADTHPRERTIVYASPAQNQYHLFTLDVDRPRWSSRLTQGKRYALMPSFSADGNSIYYVEPDDQQQFHLMRLPASGGVGERVNIDRWEYGTDLGQLVIETRNEDGELVPARLAIHEAKGHPVASQNSATFFDSQTGRHFLYSEGRLELSVPIGSYTVTAARGPMTVVASGESRVRRGNAAEIALDLKSLWSSKEAGYVSVDQHVHLNGDGHQPATHDNMLTLLAGEDLDQINPMSWNLWNRGIDQSLIGVRTEADGRAVDQSQEIRSHFHGHIGLSRSSTQYRPWFYGPNNPRFGDADQTNGDVLEFADREGAFATYVHPVSGDTDPFEDLVGNAIPTELVADGVLADRLGLELVCAWTSPLGNSAIWYRFLNLGKQMVAMSGTDSWADFHRTPAMGTARSYVRSADGDTSYDAILEQALAGRSFVTTGPALLFSLDGEALPGDVVAPGEHSWQVELISAVDVDRVEIIINGEVVQSEPGVSAGGRKSLAGIVTLPVGGWIAARAYTDEQRADSWPSMALRPFAHSSPLWINEVGSVDPDARAWAAADLLRAIDVAEARVKAAYGPTPVPRLMARFEAARQKLTPWINSSEADGSYTGIGRISRP